MEQNYKYEFTLKKGTVLTGVFIKNFIDKRNGKVYLYLLANNGKRYLINPEKAKLI